MRLRLSFYWTYSVRRFLHARANREVFMPPFYLLVYFSKYKSLSLSPPDKISIYISLSLFFARLSKREIVFFFFFFFFNLPDAHNKGLDVACTKFGRFGLYDIRWSKGSPSLLQKKNKPFENEHFLHFLIFYFFIYALMYFNLPLFNNFLWYRKKNQAFSLFLFFDMRVSLVSLFALSW